jgi:hypothetical protein
MRYGMMVHTIKVVITMGSDVVLVYIDGEMVQYMKGSGKIV